ncbi:MAG TPA: GNAT family N-acetyltransferase [Anaerolineales bacterium]|nr:GNAT family N-acetyltransferase [Anaerolineales bacterium]
MPTQTPQDAASIEFVGASLWDLNSIRVLERLSFELDAWPLIEMIGVLSLPSIERWKAMDGDKVVGFVAADVRRRQDLAWIATIAVHPDYRGRGIGGQLLELAEQRCGMARMRLSVRISNQAAQRLYQRRGYAQMDVWPKYYAGGEDAIVMEKILKEG